MSLPFSLLLYEAREGYGMLILSLLEMSLLWDCEELLMVSSEGIEDVGFLFQGVLC